MKEQDMVGFSDLPRIIKNHPFGLFISIILFGVLLIYRGVLLCVIKMLIRLPFNLTTPERILEGGICDPDKMFNVKAGEFILNLFKIEWLVILILIISMVIFLYFRFRGK